MNADQVIEGIGNVVAAAKPAQEYCLLWIDWWPMCMTKSEWAAWAQLIGVLGALFSPLLVNVYKGRKAKLISKAIGAQLRENLISIGMAIDKLEEEQYHNQPIEKQEYLARSFFNIVKISGFQGDALSVVNHSVHTRLISAENSLFEDIAEFNAECKKTAWAHNVSFYGVCVDYSAKFFRHKRNLENIVKSLEMILKIEILEDNYDKPYMD